MAEITLQAIVFHEGHDADHVLMSQLTGGHNGLVYLVKSLLDGNFYVRKQVRTSLNREPAEVSVLPHIPATSSTPRLISSRSCMRFNEFGRPVAKLHTHYFQFCNGGSLAMLMDKSWYEQRPIPELFIWHFLARMVENLAGTHLGWEKGTPLPTEQDLQQRSAVYHGDLHAGNVFLDWPSDNAILPEIYLGDFGNARVCPADNPDTAGDLVDDVVRIGTILIELVDTFNIEAFNFDEKADEEVDTWRERFPTSYSRDLFTWCDKLTAEKLPTAQELVTNLLPLAESHIKQLLLPLRFDPDATNLLRWTQPRLPDHPLLLHKTEIITYRSPLLPLRKVRSHWYFHPVTVREETFNRIAGVEAQQLRADLRNGYEKLSLTGEPIGCRHPETDTNKDRVSALIRGFLPGETNQSPGEKKKPE